MTGGRDDSRRRAVPRLAAALLALTVAALVLLPGAPALAHASLLSSDPADGAVLDAAPAEITLTFNERIQPVRDAVRLIDDDGDEHPIETTGSDDEVRIAVPGELPENGYFLNWRVISADSHPVSGVLAFGVGTAAPQAAATGADEEDGRAAVTVAAALHYLGLLVFAGFLFFKVAIAREQAPPRPRHRILRASGATAVLGSAAAVPAGALAAAGLPPNRFADVAAWSGAIRTESLVVLALTALGVAAAYWCFTRGRRAWTAPAAPAIAAVAAAAPVLVGHTRSTGPAWLMFGSDAVHLLTAAVWTGGLVGLAVLLRCSHRRGDSDLAGTASVVGRFSAWAGITVAALGLSGVTMAVLIHREWDRFIGSDHGRLLVVKLAVVALAVAIAAWNRFRLVPAIRDEPVRRRGLLRLRHTLRVEAAVVIVAIALTGALANISPQDVATDPDGITLRQELGQGEVTGVLSPGAPGLNTIEFDLLDAEGRSIDPEETPYIMASLPEEDFGPVAVQAVPDPDGGFLAEIDLPLSGRWDVEFHVRVTKFEHYYTTVLVDIP